MSERETTDRNWLAVWQWTSLLAHGYVHPNSIWARIRLAKTVVHVTRLGDSLGQEILSPQSSNIVSHCSRWLMQVLSMNIWRLATDHITLYARYGEFRIADRDCYCVEGLDVDDAIFP